MITHKKAITQLLMVCIIKAKNQYSIFHSKFIVFTKSITTFVNYFFFGHDSFITENQSNDIFNQVRIYGRSSIFLDSTLD